MHGFNIGNPIAARGVGHAQRIRSLIGDRSKIASESGRWAGEGQASPVQFSFACCHRLQPCWGDLVSRRSGEARGVDVHGQGSAGPDVGEVMKVVVFEGAAFAGDEGPELPTMLS